MLAAVNVTGLVPEVLTPAKDAVTPVGSPVIDRLTLLWNPACGAVISRPNTVDPRGTARLVGAKESVKFGAVMVSAIVVALVSAPDTPLTDTVYVPGAAVLLALKVNRLWLVVLEGLNTAVTPVGRPVALRLTLPLKPFWPVTETPLLPLPLRGTVRPRTEADRLKVGVTTVREIGAELLSVPETPVTTRE